MTAFVAIAERCSFAKAATHLGVARSTLSQNIRALEERLRVRLLNRTTRSVSLTEAGEQLLARVRPALGELAAAANELKGSRQGPTGLLRLAVQPPVASFLMGPLLGQFLSKYPGIRLDISVVKMPANIFSEGFDAGIRFGEQVERDMIAMRVTGEARFVVVASPEYLARFSVPRTPQDLQNHNCIRNRLPNGAIFGWEFEKNGRSIHAKVEGTLTVDDIDLSIHAALSGVGLAYLLYDYIAPHVASGQLVPLLEDCSPRMSGFFLYHSSRRQVTEPLRALIDFLKTETRRRGLKPTSPLGSGVYPKYRLVGPARR